MNQTLISGLWQAGKSLRLRTMARDAQKAQVGGVALLICSLCFSVLAAVVLMWSGIAGPAGRAILLVLGVLAMIARLLLARVGAVTASDGMGGAAPHSALRRWTDQAGQIILMLGAGYAAYGGGSNLGPIFGWTAAGLLVLIGLRPASSHTETRTLGVPLTAALVLLSLVSIVEPLWGWRGRTLAIGLALMAVSLVWTLAMRLLRGRTA